MNVFAQYKDPSQDHIIFEEIFTCFPSAAQAQEFLEGFNFHVIYVKPVSGPQAEGFENKIGKMRKRNIKTNSVRYY